MATKRRLADPKPEQAKKYTGQLTSSIAPLVETVASTNNVSLNTLVNACVGQVLRGGPAAVSETIAWYTSDHTPVADDYGAAVDRLSGKDT